MPQVSKSSAQSNTQVALDNLKAVSSEIRSKLDTLRPLQDREKAQREEVSSSVTNNHRDSSHGT